MGRKKTVFKRYLIGLDEINSNNFEAMSCITGMTYSELVTYLMTKFQLSEAPLQP